MYEYIPEIIVGLVLTAFAWSFRSWSTTLEKAIDKIMDRLESLFTAFHEHKIETEARVTKVETEVKSIYKRLDRCEIRKIKDVEEND